MRQSKIKKIAKDVIKIETEAVSKIEDRIDDIFESAVNQILDCRGRLIVMGMGKSGLISQKIAATMASTGTPSHFVSPAEATHGDLGMVKKEDVLLIVSNSGETMELIQVMPSVKKKGIPIIGLIGRQNSTLSKESRYLFRRISRKRGMHPRFSSNSEYHCHAGNGRCACNCTP